MKFTTNLNGDFLIPFQIFVDLSEQIPNSNTHLKALVLKPLCELKSTNDWINLEALGKPAALRALELYDCLHAQLQNHAIDEIELDIHLADKPLTIDNLYALLFLAQGLARISIALFSDSPKQANLLHLQQAFENNLKATVNCYPSSLFFHNKTRVKTSIVLEKTRVVHLNACGFSYPMLCGVKDEFSNIHESILLGYAWSTMKAGASDLACNALAYAMSSQNLAKAAAENLFMQLQIIRFLSHQYERVATDECPKTFQYLDAKSRNSLYFLKAYAATLTHHLPIADLYFKKCGIDKNMVLTDEDSLYQLNLHALYWVFKGNLNTAFQLEMRIEDFIEKQQINVLGLKYVNYINLARLHKKTKDFSQSHYYYNKAYNELRGGGFTASDHIYYNMNLGSLYEAMGCFKDAHRCWVNAASYWLASKNRYALSWRPRLILAQEKITDILTPLSIDKVNYFLTQKITSLQANNPSFVPKNISKPYQFILNEQHDFKKKSCHIESAIVIFAGTVKTCPESMLCDSELELRQLVSRTLKTLYNISHENNALMLAANVEPFTLKTREKCLSYAQINGCRLCFLNGDLINDEKSPVTKTINISLSPLIQTLNNTPKGLQIRFKRSFLNTIVCAPDEVELMLQLQTKTKHAFETLNLKEKTTVGKLMNKNLIELPD